MAPRKNKTVEEEITDLLDEKTDQAEDKGLILDDEGGEPLNDDILSDEDEPAAEADSDDEEGAEEAPATDTTAAQAKPEDATAGRVFKIGSTSIPESEATVGKSNEQVRSILKTSFPEVANATIGVTREGEQTIVSFLPQPGRKG
jgi:hypothetical protein